MGLEGRGGAVISGRGREEEVGGVAEITNKPTNCMASHQPTFRGRVGTERRLHRRTFSGQRDCLCLRSHRVVTEQLLSHRVVTGAAPPARLPPCAAACVMSNSNQRRKTKTKTKKQEKEMNKNIYLFKFFH